MLVEQLVAPHIDDLRSSARRSAAAHRPAAIAGVVAAVHLVGRRIRRAVVMSQLSEPVGSVDRA
ncbi:MAG TPA: hypothetical protein VGQ42_03890 [Candidatus Dormibacteraeota bacterium]|nr:hypothetical protein [Candidatus Dormibacteraeota bacterium]